MGDLALALVEIFGWKGRLSVCLQLIIAAADIDRPQSHNPVESEGCRPVWFGIWNMSFAVPRTAVTLLSSSRMSCRYAKP